MALFAAIVSLSGFVSGNEAPPHSAVNSISNSAKIGSDFDPHSCIDAPEYNNCGNGSNNSLPACITEDSDNCYWDAQTMGNGKGRSFTVINGEVTYQ